MSIQSKTFISLILLGVIIACNQKSNMGDTSSPANSLFTGNVPDSVDFIFHVKPILSDRCFVCHGPDEGTREAGLALHDPEFAYALLNDPTEHYAIVPYDVENSTLVGRIFDDNPDNIMPPPESNLELEAHEKEILKKWIEQGAEYKGHWAFEIPQTPNVPGISEGYLVHNEIDNFIIKRLIENNLTQADEERAEKLLRRVSFALTGLPPLDSDVANYLASEKPEKYENYVDQLLNSDAYAERMAQIWMDLARYADSHGYQDDLQRFQWPWRDWVIHAYDENMPYDQFVTWQLAGDLMPNPSLEQIVATGFNRNHKITYEGGVIPEEYRVEYVADRAQTFGTAFLGLTVECARCHDHKYDPISQKNYFEIYSFFNNVPEEGLAEPYGATPEPFVTLSKEDVESTLQFINAQDSFSEVELMVMREMDESRQAYILNRGQYDQPTTPVFPNTPESVLEYGDRPKNRLGLAEWLFDKNNPLTARVAVNRLWQQIYGEGIVRSSYDFGNQGDLPTHPELLDFLALKYQNEGWDTKAMLKYLVMSATFRQSSKSSPELQELDPANNLLARASRIRLNSEMIRDQALAAAEVINQEIGGPSVKPYQPAGLWEETIGGGGDLRVYIQDEGDKLYRRSLYTFWKRTVPPPGMMTFDASPRDLCTIKRQETNTPLQALVLMNDPQLIEAARLLAQTAIDKGGENLEERISFMFLKSTSREPTDEEIQVLKQLYKEELALFEKEEDGAQKYLSVGDLTFDSNLNPKELAAYAMLANTIFNLDESINRG